MKALIILMLMLSVVVGIPTNIGWFTLHGSEFVGPLYFLAEGRPESSISPIWFWLIMAHISVFCLPFLTKNPYFSTMLFCFPLLFVLLFILFDFLSAIFLIPFIIVWVIALFKQANKDKRQVAKTSVL